MSQPSPAAPPSSIWSLKTPIEFGHYTVLEDAESITEELLAQSVTGFKKAFDFLAKTLTGTSVSVIFRGTECSATPTQIVLPEPALLFKDNTTPEERKAAVEFLGALLGWAEHEIGHVMRSDFEAYTAFARKGPLHELVANHLEDIADEAWLPSVLPGCFVDLANKNEWQFREHVPLWDSYEKLTKFMLGMAVLGRCGKHHWFYKALPEPVLLALSVLEPEIIAARNADAKTVLEIAAVVIKKLEELLRTPAPLPPPEEEKPQEPQTDPKDDDGEDDGEEEDDETTPVVVSLPGVDIAKVAAQLNAAKLVTQFVTAATAGATYTGRYIVYSTEADVIGPWPALHPQQEEQLRRNYLTLQGTVEAQIGTLKRQLQFLMETESKTRVQRNTEDGQLDEGSLYKLGLAGGDSRVFKRVRSNNNPNDVCVALHVNQSGSMKMPVYYKCDRNGAIEHEDCIAYYRRLALRGVRDKQVCRMPHKLGTRITMAQGLAVTFGESLARLGTPFRLSGHTTTFSSHLSKERDPAYNAYARLGGVWLRVYKDWEERFEAVKHKIMLMEANGGTYDGETLLMVANSMAGRREKRKIIFTLDDGEPEPLDQTRRTLQREYLPEVVKSIMRSGIEVVALGMGTDTVKEFYPRCVPVLRPEHMLEEGAKELKRVLLG